MTAGTVVITGGILATIILLCIIIVLCYCRLQYYCCKREEWDGDEEEPDFAVHTRLPAAYYNHNVGNGLHFSSVAYPQDHFQSRALCNNCKPLFYVHQIEEIRNGDIYFSALNLKFIDSGSNKDLRNRQKFNQ
ncbi:protein FAM163B-like isoform X2 [Narcine bancroftii]|uniref:protein FAM163B-like isoform X2 n=1 Tax=Narcine bancroftii TaxID=1343680 RepID=UPI003831FA0A